jgi:uncharacterized protein|tara:strand:+ start:586 stop:1929 length:1344 start_codon:yes stop_codon:yes gene_type:complete
MKHYTSILLKPTSSRCNLDCTYCFYLRKQEIYPWEEHPSLSLDTFEVLLNQYIPLSSPHLTFLWQGGEPTMMGLPFFEAAVKLEKHVAKSVNGKATTLINNAIQTNATLLTDEWAQFFKRERFLVGVSIDGPPEWHDLYRVDPLNRPTHSKVMNGVEHLRRHNVPFNVLVVVNQSNVEKPGELLRWFIDHGFTDLQFIPCAELQPDSSSAGDGVVSAESITPDQYGQFLNILMDDWLEIGWEKVRIRWFDNLIQMLWGFPSEMCQLAPECGYIVLEHNGDCYPCDFSVDDDWFLGNINEMTLENIVKGEKYTRFTGLKSKLHSDCKQCPWKTLCYGECPSYRTINTGRPDNSLPYFCPSYKNFFGEKYKLLEDAAIEAAEYKGLVIPRDPKTAEERTRTKPRSIMEIRAIAKKENVGRNGLCPCGSGRKFKRCCATYKVSAYRDRPA